MRAISRRIGRLESSFGAIETEDMRRLRERLEAARRRMRAWRALEGIPEPVDSGVRKDLSGQTLTEILRGGRERMRQRD
jgi:hypothetical protein